MARDPRSFIADAKKLGFEHRGQSGSNHMLFVHPEHGRYTASLSPSDRHAWKNAIRDMEKMTGITLPRQKTGKYKFKKAEYFDIHKSLKEIQQGGEIDELLARADRVRQEFRQLASVPTRHNIGKARMLMHDYTDLQDALAEHHRVIDPIF